MKSHGRQLAARQFDRRSDAVAWEQDQTRRLRLGEWIDPRRSRVSLSLVAEAWLVTRGGVKRRTRETDELMCNRHIAPRFGRRPLGSVTSAEIAEWAAQLISQGLSPATASRALATFRSILDHGVADQRLIRNVASAVRPPRGAAAREGQALTVDEVEQLALACAGRYGEVVVVLAHTGLRWGELAGLKVGDRIAVPGAGLRVQRAALVGRGSLYIDTLKSHRARTVPLTARAAQIIETWAAARPIDSWIFESPKGAALRENNWKRLVRWNAAKVAIGRPTLRVHDLRHTAESLWLGAGADSKVVQRILGHASAAMTLDVYGHLIDRNLWEAAKQVGDGLGTSTPNHTEEDHGYMR